MKHFRDIIRKIVKEATMLSGPKRIALLRQMQDPDVQRYIAAVDAATTRKELQAIDSEHFISRERRTSEMLGGIPLYWTLGDLASAKEREFERAIKDAEKQRIADKKAAQQGKKDAVAAKIQRGFNNPVLKAALDRIGDGFHARLKADHIQRDTYLIERYFTDGKLNIVDPDPGHKQWMRDPNSRGPKDEYEHIRTVVRPFLVVDKPSDLYAIHAKSDTLAPNWEKVVDLRAERYAEGIVNPWKEKMSLKLGEVIDRKGGADIKLNGQLWSEYMSFTFSDASAFDMKTQQVYARSKLGKDFVRFPTTFHNVRFADGTTMPKPSSDKMQAEFGISDATASK